MHRVFDHITTGDRSESTIIRFVRSRTLGGRDRLYLDNSRAIVRGWALQAMARSTTTRRRRASNTQVI